MKEVVIIGNGIAGVTAARTLRKMCDYRIVIISDETQYHYSRTALMYVFMGHMRYEDTKPYEDWFWKKNRIELLQDRVVHVDADSSCITLKSGGQQSYDFLVIASGSQPNIFSMDGSDAEGVSGLYSIQDLHYISRLSKETSTAVIVGGGLIGIELAEMMMSQGKETHLVVREQNYWSSVLPEEEAAMINDHIRRHNVQLHLSTQLTEIDTSEGKIRAVTLTDGRRIETGFLGITIGVSPNISWLSSSSIQMDRGILVDDYLRTNYPNIYAIGDCAQLRHPSAGRRSIEAVWYVGRMMGETAAHNILGESLKYTPGIWFNSAKFFDIEYQVYGRVPTVESDDEKSLYWKHPRLEKSIRICYLRGGAVIGFNLMGIRFRHEVCNRWIAENLHVEEVLLYLNKAFFDPEFFDNYHADVIRQYNMNENTSLQLPKKGLFSFLRRDSRR